MRFRIRKLVRAESSGASSRPPTPRRVGLNVSAALMVKLDPESREEAIDELTSFSENMT